MHHAKSAEITVYTIQVNTDGDPTQAVLKKCGSPDKLFLLTSANQMVNTASIGAALSNLRIAQQWRCRRQNHHGARRLDIFSKQVEQV